MSVTELSNQLRDLAERLDRADDFFAKNGPEHPRFEEAAARVDRVVREIGEVAGQLWSLGYEWNGSDVVRREA